LEIKASSGDVATHLAGRLWTEVQVPVPADQQGKIWSLSAVDISNDLSIHFSPNLPGYISPDASKVLTNRQ
jgi:hypothetical protein